jgi:hypothetical protein
MAALDNRQQAHREGECMAVLEVLRENGRMRGSVREWPHGRIVPFLVVVLKFTQPSGYGSRVRDPFWGWIQGVLDLNLHPIRGSTDSCLLANGSSNIESKRYILSFLL